MKVSWVLSVLLLGFLCLCQYSECKKKGRMVRRLQESLNNLRSKVEAMSQPITIHVDGLDYVVDRQGHTHVEAEEDHGTEGGRKVADDSHKPAVQDIPRPADAEVEDEEDDEDDDGTHIHLHFNLPYPKANTPSQDNNSLADVYRYAKCYMKQRMPGTEHNIHGVVSMRQKPKQALEVKINLAGFYSSRGSRSSPGNPKKLHGIHIHEFGNLQNGCSSFGGHFNPEGVVHGGPTDATRHVGDWGNIKPNNAGIVQVQMTDTRPTLFGVDTIIGRGIVIHERADDLGKGGTKASLTTGDAGGRLACCVIARSGEFHW